MRIVILILSLVLSKISFAQDYVCFDNELTAANNLTIRSDGWLELNGVVSVAPGEQVPGETFYRTGFVFYDLNRIWVFIYEPNKAGNLDFRLVIFEGVDFNDMQRLGRIDGACQKQP